MMYKIKVASVALDGAVGSYDKLYTYRIPNGLHSAAEPGSRVFVPFGRGNSKRIGMVFSVAEDDDSEIYKDIISVMDNAPVLSEELLKLCVYMHDNLFCTYFDAIGVMIPAGLKFKLTDFYLVNPEFTCDELLEGEELAVYSMIKENGETSADKIKGLCADYRNLLLSLTDKGALIHTVSPKRNLGDFTRKYIAVTDKSPDSVKLTARQKEVYDAALVAGEVSVKELQYFTGATLPVINALVTKGLFTAFDKQEFRMPPRMADNHNNDEIVLNEEQNTAFAGLLDLLKSGDPETSLLYGVTGSGKTRVFMKLADEAINSGRGVIVMVPEIALTPQMINLFSSRYGNRVAVFHSAMSLGQRMDEYRRIALGKAMIAVGTRSAVFAPFENLGLIVIDEEQEHTYKSDKSPRFHARDIAKLRIKYHKGLLCLSSATPSLESYALAKAGNYKLFKLTRRYNNLSLPEVRVVNMREELLSGNTSDISTELSELIGEQLSNNKQSIILLNRRGHNTYVSCPECGYVASCDNCSITLTYHSANNRLMCHYCGHSEPLYKKCPKCGSEFLSFTGAGTQKVCEELSKIFPDARILRLDADSTMTRNAYSENLGDFADGKYDIMVGTQMVAKGLDFPKVSLVGIIGADRALATDDYRGFERTFDLLTQVIGRAGRADGRGIAVIQTNDTDNHIIDLAREQNYDAFYDEEICDRKLKVFPPYCDLCLIWSQAISQADAKSGIVKVFKNIKYMLSGDYSDQHLIILGPGPAFVPRVAGKYRYRMLIKCRNNLRFRQMISSAVEPLQKGDVHIGIDIKPETII
ncbi:MAG: primosomal protein N' [Clostridia bacterium]|nr:primosomal protein N' [Clostridia bacterium]